jgi:hypothetical protein
VLYALAAFALMSALVSPLWLNIPHRIARPEPVAVAAE